MAEKVTKQTSPRNGFVFSEVPTVRGSMYGGSAIAHSPKNYGPILDCVYEMADMISTGNGVPASQAIDMVLRDEAWRILPKHRQMIIDRLTQ